MSLESEGDAAARERLSALVDGELDGDAVARACGHWREHGEARSSWHAYHVIGDVLRSEELARDPARDAAFLMALRARMQHEPVVLAPQPLDSAVEPAMPRVANGTRSRRWAWVAPSAVAAGFAAVASVMLMTRGPSTPNGAPGVGLAQVAPAAQPMNASTLAGPMLVASEPQSLVATGKVIRDIRLDRYLDAHKQFAGSSALGVPSGFLRNATATEADR